MTAVPRLHGDPRSRGIAFARLGAAHAEAVRARTAEALAIAAAQDAVGWLAAQWQAQRALLPDLATFVEGLAEGYGIAAEALFAAHARYAVEDRIGTLSDSGAEGCSVIALTPPDGATLLAKNRDNPPAMRPLQSLVRQADPAWGGREILCVGSFGSAPSASSGINGDGLCVADTAVRTRDLGVGALRYYVMEALLIRCATVDHALALLRGMLHLGGGILAIADAGGATAAVEIGHGGLLVEHRRGPGWVARTNHFLDSTLAAALREMPGSLPRIDSEGRLVRLRASLGAGITGWRADHCAELLARHAESDAPALCRHDLHTETMSCTVFEPAARRLRISRGQPCGNQWSFASLSPSSTQESR